MRARKEVGGGKEVREGGDGREGVGGKGRMGSSFPAGLHSEVWRQGTSDLAFEAHLGGHLFCDQGRDETGGSVHPIKNY